MSLQSLLVTFVCMAMVVLPVAFSVPINFGQDAGKYQLYYLGSIEGKSFFTEQNVSLTWPEEKEFCNASGMHLASVTTEAQLALLKGAFNAVTFNKLAWTGARDSETLTQFFWDHNGVVLNSTVHSGMLYNGGFHTCVHYHPEVTENLLHAELCTVKRAVLCEIATGKN